MAGFVDRFEALRWEALHRAYRHKPATTPAAERARIALLLARWGWDLGRDRAGAMSLCVEARDLLVASRTFGPLLVQAQSWLDERTALAA